MAISRRSFIQGSAVSALGLAAGVAPQFSFAADSKDAIKIASILDLSGGLDIYGKPMSNAINLAAEEINAAGGLLGRPLQVINYDAQSNMQLYAQYAQQAALKDKVAVVHGGITSASREVIRPVLDRFRSLYFYPAQYEGGVCDRNYFSSGSTPAQTVEKLVPYAVKKWGKKVYVLAADYNYGQIVSAWVKKSVHDNGGEVVTVEFFPLDVTDFGAAISKIQSAKPDMVWSALVGGAHISFYRQWHAAGMSGKIPIASTVFGGGNEHIILSPEESNGILVAANYMQEIPSPENKAFVERFHARYGAQYAVHQRPGDGRLSGHVDLGGRGAQSGRYRSHEGDRGTGVRRHADLAERQAERGSCDASLFAGCAYRRSGKPSDENSANLHRSSAGGYRDGVRSEEKPARYQTVSN